MEFELLSLSSICLHGVIQANIACSVLVVEGIVSHMHIMVPPCQLPSVGGEHASRESAIMGSLEHREGLFIIWTLIPTKYRADMSADVSAGEVIS